MIALIILNAVILAWAVWAEWRCADADCQLRQLKTTVAEQAEKLAKIRDAIQW